MNHGSCCVSTATVAKAMVTVVIGYHGDCTILLYSNATYYIHKVNNIQRHRLYTLKKVPR
jgi:diphthamide synthase subunit DPH2